MRDEAIVVLAFMSLIPIGLLIYCWYTLRLNRCQESCCVNHGGYCCPTRGRASSYGDNDAP